MYGGTDDPGPPDPACSLLSSYDLQVVRVNARNPFIHHNSPYRNNERTLTRARLKDCKKLYCSLGTLYAGEGNRMLKTLQSNMSRWLRRGEWCGTMARRQRGCRMSATVAHAAPATATADTRYRLFIS